ncbi:MAG: immunoglobulin domain-containing protein, partial [Limisphaerales bacterium]
LVTNAGDPVVITVQPGTAGFAILSGFQLASTKVLPPAIDVQPEAQNTTIGGTVNFEVTASGSPPLGYQWTFDGTTLNGATGASLTLSNVQPAQAGAYAVEVTNAAGSVLSSNAVLTVSLPPTAVIAGSGVAVGGGLVSIPIIVVANGNENALGFSLNFPAATLSYANVTLGSGMANATLISNTNQVANGMLGLLLALPLDTTLAPGTQEVARVTFVAAQLTAAATAPLGVGDQPSRRGISDAQANSLPATFTDGSISIGAADFEGDVAPRPGGDKTLTATDWVLIGRFAARLDYPTNGSEYQRADCAPQATLGDGAITVADWVQAGRYVAGLDAPVVAGGPTNDVGPGMVSSQGTGKLPPPAIGPQPKGLNPRQLRVAAGQLAPGMAGSASVLLDAQGNENAAGFTLSFDPSVLTYSGATVGSGATGATLDINASQVASGKLAFVLALPVGGNFAAGSHELVKVN